MTFPFVSRNLASSAASVPGIWPSRTFSRLKEPRRSLSRSRGTADCQGVDMPTLSQGNREWQALTCVVETGQTPCRRPAVPDSPGPLCSHHLMLVYEFAQGIVNANWRYDLRELLGVELTEPEPPAPSWVYFLRRGDRIKIGYTTDPTTRFAALHADEVLHVEAGDMGHERALHAMFAPHWITGEWFRPAPAIFDYITRRRAA